MADRTAIVTGGAGFIGSHLCDRLLADGWRVVAVDDLSTGRLSNLADARSQGTGRFELHRLDIVEGDIDGVMAKHRPDVVFHLAAQMNVRVSVADPWHDARVNILGTISVLEAARRHGATKLVFASSGGTIYGEPTESDLPVAEDRRLAAHSPYGASKIAAEHYLETYEALYGLKWTSLALANVYGPRQDPAGEAGVVAIFTDRMLEGQSVIIFGDGEQTRDFVYVDDIVHAFVLAADKADGVRLNIGTADRTSVNRLFHAVAEAADYDLDPVYAPERPGELRHNAVDPRRAADVLGWRPWTGLEEGLAGTIEWARSER
jgi:UDP-glucose 4-epimerase